MKVVGDLVSAGELDLALHRRVVNDNWDWNVQKLPDEDFQFSVMSKEKLNSFVETSEFCAGNGWVKVYHWDCHPICYSSRKWKKMRMKFFGLPPFCKTDVTIDF